MSYFEVKKLREERVAPVTFMQDLAKKVQAESRAMNAEEIQAFDKADKEQREILAKIESAERFESLSNVQSPNSNYIEQATNLNNKYNSTISARDNDLALRGLIFRNAGLDLTSDMEAAVKKTNTNLSKNSIVCEFRDQDTATDNKLIPGAQIIGIEKALKAYGGIKSVSKNIVTANGNPLRMITSDGTASVGAVKAELAATTNTAVSFGEKVLGSFRYSSAVFMVSHELLQDSQINLSEFISSELAERLYRITEKELATGAGTTTMLGVVGQASNSSVVTASNSVITYAELLAAYHSLDPAYRANGSWVMNDSTYSVIKAMVDTTGRPLWVPNLIGGTPDTLLGKPVTVCQHLDSLSGATKKCILFGDMSKNLVRTVQGVEVQILRELYALNNAVGFVANMRMDSVLLNSAAVKYVTSKT